jgi:PAS domain S-box-containing protein
VSERRAPETGERTRGTETTERLIRELEERIREIEERERRLRLAVLASDDEIWEYAIAEDRIAFEHELAGVESPSDVRVDPAEIGAARRSTASPDAVMNPASPAPAQTGFAPTLVRGHVSLADFIATIHPDHREAFRAALDALIQARTEFEEITIRRHRRGGGWVWVQLRGRVATLDGHGRPAMIVGSARDITHMQHNADRLRLALKAAGEELWEFDIARNRTHRENPLEREPGVDYEHQAATDVFTRICHPDDIEMVHKIYVDVRWGKTREFHAVYRSRGVGGAWRWMDAHGCGVDLDDRGLPTRIIGTNRDITTLKEGEERLRMALWGSGAELWDVDMVAATIRRSHMIPDLKINALGEAIRFADLLDAVPPEHAAAIRTAIVAQAKGESEKFEVWFRFEGVDGGRRWMYSHGKVTERGPDGRALRMAGTLHDVTAMKKIEEELRRLNEQLEQRVAERTAELTDANGELNLTIQRLGETRAQLVESEKMASLGSLVAGVAHEINTPLGVGITAGSHLLEEIEAVERKLADGSLDSSDLTQHAAMIRECADLIQRSLFRADRLVRSFKQVAVHQTTEPIRRIVLGECIGESLLPFRPALEQGGHSVDIDCPPDIELETYPGAIHQILANLFANSLEHASGDARSIRMRLRVTDAGKDAAIEYRDDGLGMARETRLRIFDPFFTTGRSKGHLGLGMHVTYNLVTQLLAGSIRCESEPGEGAMFTIRIPKRAPDPRLPAG